jgi:hypothetical protein
MAQIKDIFEPVKTFIVEEKQVDGQHIIGRMKGQFGVVDGYSRNNRFYSRRLWENVLKDENVLEKLNNKTFFGMIGHEEELNDKTIGEGRVSHIVTDLKIEDDKVIGEALILNTPAGRVLNTLLRAGSKLAVSTRANGVFEGKDEHGADIVSPDKYELISVDIVSTPGILQAKPQLIESLNSDFEYCFGKKDEHLEQKEVINKKENSNIQEKTNLEDNKMNEQIFETLTREKNRLQEDLTKAINESKEAMRRNAVLESDLRKISEELKQKNELLEKVKPLKKVVEKLIEKNIITADGDTNKEIDMLDEALEKAIDMANELHKNEVFVKKAEKYDILIQELKENQLIENEHTVNEDIKDLVTLIKKTDTMFKTMNESKMREKVQQYAQKYSLPESVVRELCKKFKGNDLEVMLEKLYESKKIEKRYGFSTKIEETKKNKKGDKGDKKFNTLGESLLQRFSE